MCVQYDCDHTRSRKIESIQTSSWLSFLMVEMNITIDQDQLRLAFGKWLQTHFKVNKNSGFCFNEDNDEFYLELEENPDVTVCYSVDSSFWVIVPRSPPEDDRRIFSQEPVSYELGSKLMIDEARRHQLELDFLDNGDIVITCKKLFCLDRQFTLKKTKNVDMEKRMLQHSSQCLHCDEPQAHFSSSFESDEDIYHFIIQGMNDYKPFPDNPLQNGPTEHQIHCFILHKMLNRSLSDQPEESVA